VVNVSGARAAFEAKVHALRGLRVWAVDYWDVHSIGPEPARWDYGDWHHAVMGVQLGTDAGPRTVIWTNTFFPHGVEVFADPIEDHLALGEEGPKRIGPDDQSRWAAYLGDPIQQATVWWERLELGPATLATGDIVEPARSLDVPTAMRLAFDAGPVWFVCANPQPPATEEVLIPGDEIMIVFSAAKMTAMGYVDPTFAT
jgi:hypothetical protein